MTEEEINNLRVKDPKKYEELSNLTMRKHVECMLEFQNKGSFVFDYGNNLREGARLAGLENAFDFPGFVGLYKTSFL